MSSSRISVRVRTVQGPDSLVVVTDQGDTITVLLGGIQAPKYNSKDLSASEPYSYFGREYLREKLASHRIQIDVIKELQSCPRCVLANAFISTAYINEQVLLAGWGVVKQNHLIKYVKQYLQYLDDSMDLSSLTEADVLDAIQSSTQQESPKSFETRLVEAYLKSRFCKKSGMHSNDLSLKQIPQLQTLSASQFLNEYKKREFTGSIEYVKDANYFIILIRLSEEPLSVVKLSCTPFGIAASSESGSLKLSALEARDFSMTFLSGKSVRLVPMLCNGNTLSCKVTVLTSGASDKDYAHTLLSKGYAQCIQWMTESDASISDLYHKAEALAKEKHLGVWRNYSENSASEEIQTEHLKQGKQYAGVVVDIPSADSFVLQLSDAKILRVWFASLLMPKCALSRKTTEVEEAGFQLREYLRRNYYGKSVLAKLDYIRDPPTSNEDLPKRPYFSIYLQETGLNIAIDLIKNAHCKIIPHPISDTNRSRDYAALLEAATSEPTPQKDKKVFLKVVDYTLFPTTSLITQAHDLAREHDGCYQAVVDSVISGNKVRIYMTHKRGILHTGLIAIAGISTPSVKRNEAFGAEALEYARNTLLMKDVKVLFTGSIEKYTNALYARILFCDHEQREHDFGEAIISNGFGEAMKGKLATTIGLPSRYLQRCLLLEADAKKERIGLFKFHMNLELTAITNPGSWDAPEKHKIYGLQLLDDGRFAFCLQGNKPPVITSEILAKAGATSLNKSSAFVKQIVVYHDKERDEYFRARIEAMQQSIEEDTIRLHLFDFGKDVVINNIADLCAPLPADLLSIRPVTIMSKLALLQLPRRSSGGKKIVDEEFFSLVRQNIVGVNLICYSCGYDVDGLLNVFLFTEDTTDIEIEDENGPAIDVTASMSSWVLSEGLAKLINDEAIPNRADIYYDALSGIEKQACYMKKGIWD